MSIILIDEPSNNGAIKKKQTYFKNTDAKIYNKILEKESSNLLKE